MKKTIENRNIRDLEKTDIARGNKRRSSRLQAGLLGFAALGTAVFLLWAPTASAQDVTYKKKTVINFEDDTIEGSLKTPDGQYIEAKRAARHKSLIRIRSEFRREVLSSISDL